MSYFSPAPWVVREIELYEGGNGIEVVDAAGEVVADNQTYYPHPLDPKNAPLISAAPDLLEALQAVLGADAGCLCGHFESCANCSPSPRMREAREKARAAITKATGRAA